MSAAEARAEHLTLEPDLRGPPRVARDRAWRTDEEALCDPDRRSVETDPRITRDPESSGVEDPVAVDHQEVGSGIETAEARLDGGELPVREVSRDVREVHASLERDLLQHTVSRRIHHDCRCKRGVPVVRNVEPRDSFYLGEAVGGLDVRCETPLLPPEPRKGLRSLELPPA